jgi:hypothetical protein
VKADVRKHPKYAVKRAVVPDEWKAVVDEHEQDLLDSAVTKLRNIDQGGVTLTKSEGTALRLWIEAAKIKRPRGRPRGPDAVSIALVCRIQEVRGVPLKAAVADTVKFFRRNSIRVSRASVYAALRKTSV